ncbi:GH92 family glycosyl hydrolase [Puia sp. P3]|uniref:GH92 family glycosyl hydrolase n=1 Tax=Puia sp. P3 TaxID=3423952 RepID=UPI003D66D44D
MAKLAPSTNGHYGNASGWEAVGYDTRQNSIEGFVHFHEWQVGGVCFMPTVGAQRTVPGDLDKPGSGYRSAFARKNQQAEPGYYKVLLDDYDITAELDRHQKSRVSPVYLPGQRPVPYHPRHGQRSGESGPVTNAGIKMVDPTHFEGYVITNPKYVQKYDPGGKVSMYIYGEVSKAPLSTGSFTTGLNLNYTTTRNEQIGIKVGLSYTSIANAKANLLAEAKDLSFDEAKAKAQEEWRRQLGRITITDTSRTNKVKFYTGLFHALLGRGVASDVNGAYPKHGGVAGQLEPNNYNFINTDAIWGAFWNLTQLWSLSYPEYYRDFVHTQLQVCADKGWFGDGIANSEYVSGVGTNLVGLAIAAGYQTGLRDYDVEKAWQAIKNNELGWKDRPVGSGKMDTKAFLKYGYSPYLEEDRTDSSGAHFSASHTLEYSFSAFAAAQMAKRLGKQEDYEQLIRLSNGWRLLYNPTNQLLQPKTAAGSFIDKFDPYAPWRGYQEGNAMQYTFYVPQNPHDLVATLGRDYFNEQLNDIFEKSEKDGFGGGKTINAFAGITSIYNHGNEPSLHVSWLFNFSGRPWLTQKWTRAICNEFYGIEPIHGYGYGQDEDQGQLGAWYIMAALGLFDVKGFTDAKPIVELGSPIIQKAVIRLGNGKQLSIETTNNSAANLYVQSVQFNGLPLHDCWLYRDDLMKGGKLLFIMGPTPNKQWGVKIPPPSAQ